MIYTEDQVTEIVKRVIKELQFVSRDDKLRLARDSQTSSEILEQLATDGDSNVRICVALHPNTPPEILEQLATDESSNVRRGVAKHPNTPPEVLEILATNESSNVRYYAVRNPNYDPPETITITKKQKQALKDLIISSQNPILHHINLG
jgi:hypothetical protein